MDTRTFRFLLKFLLFSKVVLAFPQLDALNSDLSPISTSDLASVENQANCDTQGDNVNSLLPGSENLALQDDPSGPANLAMQDDSSESEDLALQDNSSEPENLALQDDSSGTAVPEVSDISKRLVGNSRDSQSSSPASCPAQNKITPPRNQPNLPPSSRLNVKPVTTGADDGCRIDHNTERCEVASATLIYSRTCKATTDNHLVTLELNKMVGSVVRVSNIKGCGVFFWFAKLKPSQANRVAKFKAVRGISPDGKMDYYGTIGKPVQTNSKKRLKRDNAVPRTNRGSDLAHLSTAPQRACDHQTYTFFQSAGQATIGGTRRRTVAYVLGDGVNEYNYDILRIPTVLGSRTSIVDGWLYGMGTVQQETIEASNRHLTTCLISKIAGVFFGVASEASIVMVKVLDEISSFLDGLIQIISDIGFGNQRAAGFTVVSISHGWKSTTDRNLDAMRRLFEILEGLGVVIVCAAGKLERGGGTDVSTYPALWSTRSDMSIITVSSVDQFTESTPYWAPTGDGVTVSAPGFCTCATSDSGPSTVKGLGTPVSASLVTGLLLAFAALEDVGPKLRSYLNVPRAFKAYLLRKAYVRRGGSALSVWNGLSAEITDQWIPDADNLVENDERPDGGTL